MPGAPSIPEVCEITDESMTIKWTSPDYNGGAPINRYTVEYMKQGDNKWVPLETGSRELSYTVQGLQKGAGYLFRVSATNKV